MGQPKLNLMQPSWTADNRLLVISDLEKWWNLYTVENLASSKPSLKCVHKDLTSELGGPCWNFGDDSYCPNPKNADQVFVLYGGVGKFSHLARNTLVERGSLQNYVPFFM